MAKVIMTGKPAESPIFGVSRGALIPLRRKLGLSAGASSQPKKEMSKASREATEAFLKHRGAEAKEALSGDQG